ncbi:HK97 family phage prohead protease [Clostridium botulinum]|nr:HK97 family phage prohead protease [Clostridium botulinum]
MRVSKSNDGVLHIEGYVNAVERDSNEIRSYGKKFVEQVKARTFEKALRRTENINLLYNHRKDRVLGRTKDNTVQLYEDAIGLHISADIKDKEVIEDAEKGKLTGFSFGFNKIKENWERISEDKERRYLEDIKLTEVSLLNCRPVYNGTSVVYEKRSDNEEDEILELRFEEDKQDKIESQKNKLKVDMSEVYKTNIYIINHK